ncbi:MAG: cofactor-independent phosphoglycerate mutase [Deltaproteobacteria bacterium HGW-Deltaproteobacteria-17]|nr:MAG: cofactor-independent phosphoglycerate mutase [Deltaproteobacteria bacterium HGW-Deltaproteobacteria-17]
MKTIIILGDGMADLPIDKLGGKTILQAARKPHIDRLAALGRSGMLKTVPDDMPAGSEVANLAVLGYDVKAVYEGRGVLEGAAMGVELEADDLAMRCNLICLEGDRIKNHSAGHISTGEGRELIAALNEELARDGLRFHPGVSYRHLLVIRGGDNALKLTPPHDVPGTPWLDVLPEATAEGGKVTAQLLRDLIVRSQDFLATHPVNLRRVAAGKDPANSIWPWSAGRKPRMKTYQELFGRSGAVISAVDLLHGIGKYAGFRVIHVEGATGLYNTNYEGKVAAALSAIRDVDLVYLHIEAADEAGHEGNADLKLQCVEALDARVVGPIMEATAKMSEPVALAVLPDHPTPCALRTHTHDPVPFLIYKPGMTPDAVERYDEQSALAGGFGQLQGDGFIRALFAD